MRLPVPIFLKGSVYGECEIEKPRASVIADVKKMADTGDVFSAMRILCNGCITEFKTTDGKIVTDSVSIKALVPKMSQRTAEFLSIQIMLLYYPDDDGIEGVYPCPRCGYQVISEYSDVDGMIVDTRDFISQLEVNFFEEGDSPVVRLNLTENVTIENKAGGDVLYDIESMEMEYPTLEHSINAFKRFGVTDDVRLQFGMYAEALTTVNGKAIDNKFRNSYGVYVFENIREVQKDLGSIARQINKYGVNRSVEKTCKNCGKVWRPLVNTTNFFVSAPLSI